MKLTAKIKLKPTLEQRQELMDTLRAVNAACNYISEQAWEHRTFRQFSIHKLTYYDVREQFKLASQMTVRAISKVANGYKVDRHVQRSFRPMGAIDYDNRILSWDIDKQIVNILTLQGRRRIPFVAGEKQLALLQTQHGETKLAYIGGHFYLLAACDVNEPPRTKVKDYVGVDMGIVNIATDSDGHVYSGAHINGLRRRYTSLRSKLQKKGTKSAKRLLRKRRHKEQRFARNVNHCISKEIVLRAERTGRGIALEDLTGIRDRIRVRKAQRRQHHSWTFSSLRLMIEYKACLHGVPVVVVDPRHTSQQCSVCGHTEKANRKTQSEFVCCQCGTSLHADFNAAINIGRRAAVNQPNADKSLSVA